MLDLKLCCRCKKNKHISEFGIRKASKDGLNFYCLACSRIKAKSYRRQHHSKTILSVQKYRRNNPEKVKDSQLRTKYGISLEELKAKIESQNFSCHLCGIRFSSKRNECPVVDHDHKCCKGSKTCGKCIRKILCLRCNSWLGRFENKPEVFLRAYKYILEENDRTASKAIGFES